jgi:hypothetical protein
MLSVTDNSRGARGDMELVPLRRITRLDATYLSGQDRAGLYSDSGVTIYGLAQPDRSNTLSCRVKL